MDVSQLLADLDTIKHRIWTANVTKMDFETIREKVHRLNCELQVHEALADTKNWLYETKRPNNRYRTKVEKMVMMVHGAVEKPGIRYEMLQSLDMKAFMFVSASYTVLEIKKMSQDVFDCLLEVAPKYVDTITLPSGWMHRTELQTAVAGYAKPGSAFKRSM
jgi:2-succinyl-5-enolpyruvyl-6-hydroxy-3-cyclohexene-1-carboxylate synthase